MSDPYSGYINHPVETVKKAMAAIMPNVLVETIENGTNPTPGMKPNRLRLYYDKSTRLVSRVVAG